MRLIAQGQRAAARRPGRAVSDGDAAPAPPAAAGAPMILVDTSIWIDHGRRRHEPAWPPGSTEGLVLGHPFVQGELACGQMPRRAEVLALFDQLPPATVVPHRELLQFVDRHRLMGQGLGWIDLHLLGVRPGQPRDARDARRAAGAGRARSRRKVTAACQPPDPVARSPATHSANARRRLSL